METLLNAFGGAAFWPVLLAGGLVAGAGFVLRARALGRVEAIGHAQAARRRVHDVVPGLCAVEGRWRGLDERRGLVEDDSGAAVVTLAGGHESTPPVDGARVLIVGLAGGTADDPRGAGYRGEARLPHIAVVDAGHFVRAAERGLERAAVVERAAVTLGGAAFGVGLALAASAAIVALRASGS